jgi:hypothetical protein
MGAKRNAYSIVVGKTEGRRPLGGRGYRWGILLKYILERQNGMILTGLIWLRIGTSGGLL